MTVYIDLVVLLNFAVDLLLLLGTNRLCGHPLRFGRSAAAAALGGIYAGACILPSFGFLGNGFWRIVFLAIMGAIAFGFGVHARRRVFLFVILSLALGGMAVGFQEKSIGSIVLGAGGIFLLCHLGFRGKFAGQEFVEVVLQYGEKTERLTALCDTGNTLKDPITGESVLVVDSDVAKKIAGLTEQELLSPISTMETQKYKNLRLIPYRAVGQPNGMLLALRMDTVTIDKKNAGTLVAFAPQQIGKQEGYQALTGGVT